MLLKCRVVYTCKCPSNKDFNRVISDRLNVVLDKGHNSLYEIKLKDTRSVTAAKILQTVFIIKIVQ